MMYFKTNIDAFRWSRKGSVAVFAALILPVMLGFSGLVAELGHALLIKTENQRVADQAAYAAALTYGATNSTDKMNSVAQNVAVLNGLPSSSITVVVDASSPKNAADTAIEVTVSTNEQLLLAPILHFTNNMTVSASAYAQIPPAAGSCVLALSQSLNGITLSGGTSITAPTCAVASNNSIAVPCGDYITALNVDYWGANPTVGCPGGVNGPQSHVLTADPLAANAGVIAAAARAIANASLTAPTFSAVASAPSITFDYSGSATAAMQAAGCATSFSGGTWTVTCPAGGTYHFGSLTLSGGISTNFNIANSATYDFSGMINNQGSALTFGSGTFNIAQGVQTGGGTKTTFGAGTINIGKMTSGCNGAGNYSLCVGGGSTLTFSGPSSFSLIGGIDNSGGVSTVTLGAGTTNSYQIGPSSDGYAMNLGGTSYATFADATGSGDLFQIVGNISEGGNSCLALPATTNHDIEGNVNISGGLSLGVGLYAISGYAGFGVSAGGDVWCPAVNANIGVSGTNVTIAVAGLTDIPGGNCNGDAFCVGSGFQHVSIVAPSSGTYQNLAVIGPTSQSNNAGASMTEGASGTDFGGALYFPNGPLTLTGGASIGAVSGQCLQIVASQITLSGGTSATASPCFQTSAGPGTPVLVQ